MTLRRPPATVVLGLILVIGLVWRLINIGFGLPAMYDPDEPLFVMKAFKLLNEHTLNPGWFGHPGTTTIYLLAGVDLLVAGTALASGRFATLAQFAAGVYAHPGLIFIPSRLAMVMIAVGTIWLTYLIASRLFDTSAGLLAAAFLAFNALHIAWSQVIRTDIHCSLFMLASLLFAIRGAHQGARRDFLVAGLFAGFAMATKWPGGSILIAVAGAAFHRWQCERRADAFLRPLIMAAAAALIGLFIASPFILLDWRTVIADVGGEVATGHLGHSGHGLVLNLGWYLQTQVAGTMGWLGLALTLAGLLLLLRDAVARVTLLPATLVFLALISAQPQIWSRWLTPVLPMLSIAAALATVTAARWITARSPARFRPALHAIIALVALAPSVAGAAQGTRERANDTRDQASAWARAHIPPGRTIVVEHLALDLRPQPWRILFPIGTAGCVDGRRALSGGVKYEDVQKARRRSPIVDLGNIPTDKLASCKADYAILTYYDLYLAERKSFPNQIDSYNRLIGAGHTVAVFRTEPGVAGWPVTRIVALGTQ
ncbi:MAG: glycosyltransferase family 39 protein [Sphingomonadales bacterium]|nr:glycosyltransferase family 39 protein [Sphingomonadales bacterium]